MLTTWIPLVLLTLSSPKWQEGWNNRKEWNRSDFSGTQGGDGPKQSCQDVEKELRFVHKDSSETSPHTLRNGIYKLPLPLPHPPRGFTANLCKLQDGSYLLATTVSLLLGLMFCCCLINVSVRAESRKWFPLGPRVSQEQARAGVGRVRRHTTRPHLPSSISLGPGPSLSDFHQIHLFLYCPATKQNPGTDVTPSPTGKMLLSLRPPALRKSHLSLRKGTSPTWSGVEWCSRLLW